MESSAETTEAPLPSEPDSNELVVMSGEELVEFFNSPKFRIVLNGILGRLRKTKLDTELGFVVYTNPGTSETTVIYDTQPGTGSTDSGEKGSEKQKKQEEKGSLLAVKAHTHPLMKYGSIFTYTPSGYDLRSLQCSRNQDGQRVVYPLGLIIIDKGPKNTEFVVFQETKGALNFMKGGIIAQYDKDVRTNETISDVLDLLENYDFEAAHLTYNGEGLTQASADRLRHFRVAFQNR